MHSWRWDGIAWVPFAPQPHGRQLARFYSERAEAEAERRARRRWWLAAIRWLVRGIVWGWRNV